ncbi:hypothetical protein ALC57_14987 [Trachymyrmex cornetzi]|uniref:Uncharacterized protein n=1 Tax=Trachymyrmex cornetzi TaxID=471704 RepID=A0A195DJC8_9HYME|nr:hypothetical protein ALC57_14987 [Trachymyrmex cornetzi]
MRTTVHQHDRNYRNSNETMVADGLDKRGEGGDSMGRDETTLTTHRYAAQPVQSSDTSTSTIDYREISNTYVNDTQSIGADHSTPDRETGRCDTYTQTPKARRRESLITKLGRAKAEATPRVEDSSRTDDMRAQTVLKQKHMVGGPNRWNALGGGSAADLAMRQGRA